MQREVLEQPALAAFADRIEFVAVDTDRVDNAAFLARHPVALWPTFFVLDPQAKDGLAVAVHPGAASLPDMVAFIEGALARTRSASADNSVLAGLLAAVDRAVAVADVVATAAAWDAVLVKVGPGHARRQELLTRAAWSRVKGDPAGCIAFIEAHRPEFTRGSAPGDLESGLLSCADRLTDAAAQARARASALVRLRALVEQPPEGAAVDDRADTMATLAGLAEQQGDKAAVVALHERRLRLLEDDAAKATTERGAQVHDYARLNSLLYLQRGDEAVALLTARAKAIPDDYEPPARLASALFRLQRHDEARTAAKAAIDKSYGPRRLRYLMLLTDIEAARKDAPAAQAALQRVVDESAALPATMQLPGVLKDARARLAAP